LGADAIEVRHITGDSCYSFSETFELARFVNFDSLGSVSRLCTHPTGVQSTGGQLSRDGRCQKEIRNEVFEHDEDGEVVRSRLASILLIVKQPEILIARIQGAGDHSYANWILAKTF
jgi:hypothetical protein